MWVTALLVVAMELGVCYAIRDNLTLDIAMLVYPSETIHNWQQGGS